MSTPLTLHFTLEEAIVTNTGLDNTQTPEVLERALNTAYNMEVVRAILGRKAIHVNSWCRNEAVNTHVGGVPDSEHLLGAAVDFTCPGFGSVLDVCRTLAPLFYILNYNQLIYENTWCHISFPLDGQKGKGEVLTVRPGKQYVKGIQP